ncbi:hypothetical protein FN846DRAFT_889870 [Sphaerosporella brunnea]|uniref:Uncharacterized protein n=1 Tax=Sphaerosporella brunnea TaxID=1250544 RepID=A0A5J5EYF3_9PEZI|nr:hypothetical protein FN846DRAFT_889870 [Sphaerosporella brunnea]
MSSLQVQDIPLDVDSSSIQATQSSRPPSRRSGYSLEDSLREVAGTITLYQKERRARANSILSVPEAASPVNTSTDHTDVLVFEPPFAPPPFVLSDNPLQNSPKTSDYEAGGLLTTDFQPTATVPGRGTQGVFSTVKTAFLSKHSKKLDGKGKEKVRVERVETPKDDNICKGTPAFANILVSGFNKPWKRGKKETGKAIPRAQSEAHLLTTADLSNIPEETAFREPLPEMVRILFKTPVGGVAKTCWTSLNAVDTWEACVLL